MASATRADGVHPPLTAEALQVIAAADQGGTPMFTSANLARVYQRLGERTEARAMYGTAASTFHALGDRSHEAGVLANLADLALEEGDLPTAWEQGARALALYREIGETPGAAAAQGGQGLVLALRGDLPAAERELTAAAAGLDAAGAKLAAARQRIELAGVLVDAGRAAAGEALAQSALAALGDRPTPVDEVAARTVLATAALAQGQKDRAAAQVARSARVLAACASRTVHLQAAIAAARVHAAAGQAPEATAELRAAADEAMRLGLRPLALEARLALAEIAAGSRGGASARGPLEAVTREAAAAGFGGIAEQARRALSRPRAPS